MLEILHNNNNRLLLLKSELAEIKLTLASLVPPPTVLEP